VHQNPQHGSLLTVGSTASAPPFQPLHHQQNVCHQHGFFSRSNGWKSLGAKSRLWGRCSRSSHCSLWILSWVAYAVWSLALSCWSSTSLACLPGHFMQIASGSFYRTSQYDAECTFSPCFWKWANSTPWESQNMVSITFPTDDINLKFELFGWRWTAMFPLHFNEACFDSGW
jgi:hypothetical protein